MDWNISLSPQTAADWSSHRGLSEGAYASQVRCALCFAGDTHATYPLMLQLANAIAAHQPARERSLDLSRVKDHLLRLFMDLAGRFEVSFEKGDIQFIFAGYSWRTKDFRIWTILYQPKEKLFRQREARSFCSRLRKAAFIGDCAKQVRAAICKWPNGLP